MVACRMIVSESVTSSALTDFGAGKLDFEWDSATGNAWPGYKEQTVFGQLPQLEDGMVDSLNSPHLERSSDPQITGSVKVAQSMAIARYISRKAGLQVSTIVAPQNRCSMFDNFSRDTGRHGC
jgi:hypothetical protein